MEETPQLPVVLEQAPRVLVVDDDGSVRAFAERVLRGAGYEVIPAADGPDALRIVEHAVPGFDLFVIDLMMPQMQGDELVRQLRRIEPEAKVLYFTGYSEVLFKEKPVLPVNEAYVEKPVTIRSLLEAVSLLLFGHTRGPRNTRLL